MGIGMGTAIGRWGGTSVSTGIGTGMGTAIGTSNRQPVCCTHLTPRVVNLLGYDCVHLAAGVQHGFDSLCAARQWQPVCCMHLGAYELRSYDNQCAALNSRRVCCLPLAAFVLHPVYCTSLGASMLRFPAAGVRHSSGSVCAALAASVLHAFLSWSVSCTRSAARVLHPMASLCAASK